MEQYRVTGMSCAACSSRVEKAVSNVPGVTSCSVSLLTNSMGVEGTASASEIIAAVEASGYGASLKNAENGNGGTASAAAADEMLKDTETPKMKRRLIASLVYPVAVCINGTYDEGMAVAFFYGRKSYCDGSDAVTSDNDSDGDQSEILCQWV